MMKPEDSLDKAKAAEGSTRKIKRCRKKDKARESLILAQEARQLIARLQLIGRSAEQKSMFPGRSSKNDATEEDIKDANEAALIMKRLAVIKSKLSSYCSKCSSSPSTTDDVAGHVEVSAPSTPPRPGSGAPTTPALVQAVQYESRIVSPDGADRTQGCTIDYETPTLENKEDLLISPMQKCGSQTSRIVTPPQNDVAPERMADREDTFTLNRTDVQEELVDEVSGDKCLNLTNEPADLWFAHRNESVCESPVFDVAVADIERPQSSNLREINSAVSEAGTEEPSTYLEGATQSDEHGMISLLGTDAAYPEHVTTQDSMSGWSSVQEELSTPLPSAVKEPARNAKSPRVELAFEEAGTIVEEPVDENTTIERAANMECNQVLFQGDEPTTRVQTDAPRRDCVSLPPAEACNDGIVGEYNINPKGSDHETAEHVTKTTGITGDSSTIKRVSFQADHNSEAPPVAPPELSESDMIGSILDYLVANMICCDNVEDQLGGFTSQETSGSRQDDITSPVDIGRESISSLTDSAVAETENNVGAVSPPSTLRSSVEVEETSAKLNSNSDPVSEGQIIGAAGENFTSKPQIEAVPSTYATSTTVSYTDEAKDFHNVNIVAAAPSVLKSWPEAVASAEATPISASRTDDIYEIQPEPRAEDESFGARDDRSNTAAESHSIETFIDGLQATTKLDHNADEEPIAESIDTVTCELDYSFERSKVQMEIEERHCVAASIKQNGQKSEEITSGETSKGNVVTRSIGANGISGMKVAFPLFSKWKKSSWPNRPPQESAAVNLSTEGRCIHRFDNHDGVGHEKTKKNGLEALLDSWGLDKVCGVDDATLRISRKADEEACQRQAGIQQNQDGFFDPFEGSKPIDLADPIGRAGRKANVTNHGSRLGTSEEAGVAPENDQTHKFGLELEAEGREDDFLGTTFLGAEFYTERLTPQDDQTVDDHATHDREIPADSPERDEIGYFDHSKHHLVRLNSAEQSIVLREKYEKQNQASRFCSGKSSETGEGT